MLLTEAHVKSKKVAHFIFFIPQRTLICDRILEEEGVIGDIMIGEFYLDLVSLEEDVLSLEMPMSFRDLFLVTYCIIPRTEILRLLKC